MPGNDQPTNLGDFELLVMLAVVRIGEKAQSRRVGFRRASPCCGT